MRPSVRATLISTSITGLVLAGAAPLAQARPAASGFTFTSIYASSTKITTSSGKHLHLSVFGQQQDYGSGPISASLSVTLSTSVAFSTGETHNWSFNLTPASVSYTAGTGKGLIKTATQINPYGQTNLTFTKSSQSKTSCSGGSTTTVKGSLKGLFKFDTRTTGWGHKSSSSFSFTQPDYVVIQKGSCTGKAVTATCTTNLSWRSPGTANSSPFTGYTIGKTATISASRGVSLSTPANSSRSDQILLSTAKPTLSNGKLTITSPGGLITGRASMSGGTKGTDFKSKCKHNGVNKTQHNVTWQSTKWAMPTGHHLVAHFQIEGVLRAPTKGNKPTSSYTKASFS